jgi:hypothetical protein
MPILVELVEYVETGLPAYAVEDVKLEVLGSLVALQTGGRAW